MSLSIRKWARKRADRPRYFVCDGRQAAGTVFESHGIFSAVDPDGRLVAVRENLKAAIDSLTTRASS